MNSSRIACLALGAFVLAVCSLAFPVFLAAAQPPDARMIMQQVYDQTATHTIKMRASFTIYDRQGHSRKEEFLYRRQNSDAGRKILAVFTAPAEVSGVALLSVQQHGLPAKQYIYTPAIERVRSVETQERSNRFLGTDFSYEEITDRDLDDFSYRLIDDGEAIDGRKTYKIEARPVDVSRSQYAYIYIWVAKEMPAIVYAQMYSTTGVVVRILHSTDLRRVDGVWGARRTEVSTPADETRTILTIQEVKLNIPLDEAAFSPQSLAASVAASHR
jgi:Outer membrane lipoprotein-sorting protein